jgi:hypothetical protein
MTPTRSPIADGQRPGDEGWDEFIVPCMDFIDEHIKK